MGCSGELVGPDGINPSPSPIPSPSPTPIPVKYDRTFIFRSDSPTNYSWSLGIVPTLEANQQCSQDRVPIDCPYNPGLWSWV